MANCPQCGEQSGSDDPAGLCPQCLILRAFNSPIGADGSATQSIETPGVAEQLEPIHRWLALKVVKLGMDITQVLAASTTSGRRWRLCGIVGLDLIGALVHLQLGRVFALSGNKAKAKAAYEAIFALWKNADPTVPVLRSAKTEYSRL